MVIRLGLAQINTTVGAIKKNTEKIIEYIEKAREREVGLLVFPELTTTGYPPEDLLLRTRFIKDNLLALDNIKNSTIGSKIIVLVGFVDYSMEIYNSVAVIQNGEIVATYRKNHLPNYSVFDEKRYFSPGNTSLILKHGTLKIGVNICEDLWVPSGPINDQAIAGASIILNLSASPFVYSKDKSRQELLATRAMEYSCTIGYCNLVGGQDELIFDGRSMVVTPDGKSFTAKAFEEELLMIDLDPDISTRYNLYEGKRKGYSSVSGVEEVEIDLLTRDSIKQKPVQQISAGVDEEIFNALVVGVRDYVRKNGFKEVAFGLSGGMDSSLVAAIASEAIGPENVYGIILPSHITSKASVDDATVLAENLGMKTMTLPIKDVFDSYINTLFPFFKDTEENVAEENIQARIRGTLWMALSNKFGWLILTTGNKSEMATGYATLYGDMAGGFSVLKDVFKTEVYRLARYYNELKGKEIIPENVFIKAPTAELKLDQTDQDSLPPYEILDEILRLFIEEGLSRDEIIQRGFELETVHQSLRLLERNEYKRKQAAPGIKVSRRAFGKDWRMPITNGYRVYL